PAKLKASAAWFVGGDADRSACGIHDSSDQGEAHAAALERGIGGEALEHLEHAFAVSGCDPGPIMYDFEERVGAVHATAHRDASALLVVMLDGIADQVEKHAFERTLHGLQRGHRTLDANLETAGRPENARNASHERR